MKNKTDLSQKIRQIRQKFANGDNKTFAKQLGFTEQYCSNICNGTKSIGSSVIDKLCMAYPTLNRDWLLSDIGEMESTHRIAEPAKQIVSQPNNTALLGQVALLKELLAEKDTRIEQLNQDLREQQLVIASLKQQLSHYLQLKGEPSSSTIPTEMQTL